MDLLISLRCSTFRLAGGLVDRISQAALADMLHLERKNLNGVGLPVALALFEFTDGAAAEYRVRPLPPWPRGPQLVSFLSGAPWEWSIRSCPAS